jgi:branched-chain amino acid aminotransferase
MVATLDFKITPIAQSRLAGTDFNKLPFGRVFSDHMLWAEFIKNEWQTPHILPYGKMEIAPSMLAIHYGQSIFEGMKAHRKDNGEIVMFRPELNFQRMNASAVRMCMPQIPEEIFLGGLVKLLQIDQGWVPTTSGSSMYLRPVMFGSDEVVGMHPSDSYTFVVMGCPSGPYYEKPLRMKIETEYVRAASGGIGSAKTAGNYAASLYPTRSAQNKGYDQIIWTDSAEHQYIEESGTMNLMFKIDGKIITPDVHDTILNGVTRRSLIHLAKHWGYEVEERKLSIHELRESLEKGTLEEFFGVGTAAVIAHMAAIGFNDKDFELKPLNEDGFALKAKKYLQDLCKGKIKDEFGWLYSVPTT